MIDLKSLRCRRLKRWNTGAPVFISLSRFAGAVPLLYCADAFEIQRKGRLELSLVAFRMKCPHTAHTGTHRSTVRGWLKTNTVKYGHCYTAVAATTSKAYGVIQAHSSSRQHSKDEEEQ